MIGSLSGVVLGLLLVVQIRALVLWYRPGEKSFAWRLDQLLALLLAEKETAARRHIWTSRLGRVKWSARRWRGQLRSIYVQGYQAAAETLSPSGHLAHGHDLVQETLTALRAERMDGGARVRAGEDPVVLFAYGLGAWPPGTDLASLERLLAEIGVSQPALRSRFDSLSRLVATSQPTREFRELAAASFVLGAAARILEAVVTSSAAVPPPGFLTAFKTYLR